jgi:hypothetical protein
MQVVGTREIIAWREDINRLQYPLVSIILATITAPLVLDLGVVIVPLLCSRTSSRILLLMDQKNGG